MNIKPTYEELEQRVGELEKDGDKRKRAEAALRESEEKYQTILQRIEDGYYEVDIAGNFTFCNDSMCEIAGYPRDELLLMNNRDCTTLDTAKRMYRSFNEVYRTGNPSKIMDYEIIRKDGGARILEMSASLMRDSSGQPTGFCGIARDVTERKRAENGLQAVNQQLDSSNRDLEEAIGRANRMAAEAEVVRIEFDQIFNTSPDGMWVIDEHFNVLRANETFLTLFGKGKDEVIGRNCYDVFPSPLCHSPNCSLLRIQNGEKRIELDTEIEREDGMKTPLILTATPFRGLAGELIGIVENLKDITDRKRAEVTLQKANRELERLASMDGLTQVANRRQFDKYLNQEWRRMSREQLPLSLIMCDIDFFKLYNDTYGHQMGDDCLRDVARAISVSVKRPGDLLARYGGEEFAVILPSTNAEGAVHIAETIRTEVQRLKIAHAGSSVNQYVTLTLGVTSVVPYQKLTPEALVEVADRALYEGKKNGRNRVILKTFQ